MNQCTSEPLILLTGATGFVGSHLVVHLAKIARPLLLIRPGSAKNVATSDCPTIEYRGDIDGLIAQLSELKVDGAIHLASQFVSEHRSSQVKELVDSNVGFGAQMMEACHCAGVGWFINTGTFWQHYHNADYLPVNLYAATKQALEAVAAYYIDMGSMSVVNLELSDTYGPRDLRPKLMNLWKECLSTGKQLEMSDGTQLLDISHVDDVCLGFVRLVQLLCQSDPRVCSGDSFVVSADKRLSLRELAALVENVSGKILNIKWGARPHRSREVMVPYENGRTVPGWRPSVKLEEGIRQLFCEEIAQRGIH